MILFHTKHIRATTTLSAQFNFNNNNNSTYHCNGSMHECLIMEGIDSELIFMNSVHTTRMLDEVNPKSIADNAALFANKAVVDVCGCDKSYNSCLPNPNHPPPSPKPSVRHMIATTTSPS